jgi:molybdate transport system regulatory protein
MNKTLRAQGRFWLTLDKRNFLGRGRIELLQHIHDTGSIAQAARAMRMSYKAAWDAVDAMNSAWGSALVEKGPAGSVLTADAHRLMRAYREGEARLQALMDELTDTLTGRGAGPDEP